MFKLELELILLIFLIISYSYLIVNFLVIKMSSLWGEKSKKIIGLKLNSLVSFLLTFLYFSFYYYNKEKYHLFLMNLSLFLVLIVYLISYSHKFFIKSEKKMIDLMDSKRDIVFYFKLKNPLLMFYGISLIFGVGLSLIIQIYFIYKIIFIIMFTQFFGFLCKKIFNKKLSYYEYLSDILIEDSFNLIELRDIVKYQKIKSFSLIETYILSKIYNEKNVETFFYANKLNSRLSNIYRQKAFIFFKTYELLKIRKEDRGYFSPEEILIIEILKSLKNKDFFKAEILYKKLDEDLMKKYDELYTLITESKTVDLNVHYDDPKYYIIEPEDFNRKNPIERYFHKYIKFKLLKAFDNQCPKTGKDVQLEMDHFFIPKSNGGNFILKRKDGRLILNAIPLHKDFNQLKSNGSYDKFFSNDEIKNILSKITHLNDEINKEGIDI